MDEFHLRCPIPRSDGDIVQLAHGGGGRLSQRLIESVFLSEFGNSALDARHDASVLATTGKIAMTTDAFVVQPWRFPGGDIGSLSVHGTVNDLAMAGAKPVAISASFILEEGFRLEDLKSVVYSMRDAALAANVPIVAGDTKVVERGKGDGIYICTTGIGEIVAHDEIGPAKVRPGDAVIVSGDIARHGVAIMVARESLNLGSEILSDAASVHQPVLALIEAGIQIHCLRDPTRGGLATVLNEIARDGTVDIAVNEENIPVGMQAQSVCELLGLDPLYVACEGRFVAWIPEDSAAEALAILRQFDVSSAAVQIGAVRAGAGRVTLRSKIGIDRVLDLLTGEQLPRIC